MATLHRPTNRNWPSVNCVARSNMQRQLPGLNSGIRPSNTSINASAPSQRSDTAQSDGTQPATLPAHGCQAARYLLPPPLRMALKKSLLGSTTITSLLFLKLAR